MTTNAGGLFRERGPVVKKPTCSIADEERERECIEHRQQTAET